MHFTLKLFCFMCLVGKLSNKSIKHMYMFMCLTWRVRIPLLTSSRAASALNCWRRCNCIEMLSARRSGSSVFSTNSLTFCTTEAPTISVDRERYVLACLSRSLVQTSAFLLWSKLIGRCDKTSVHLIDTLLASL